MSISTKFDKEPCQIVQELVSHGYEAYIVGGAVRDLLLDADPKDYDIATSATPEEVRVVFGRKHCRIIGRRFRLAHVYFNSIIYEVSTFRRMPTEEERRGRCSDNGKMIWNDNYYGTLEQDAMRRDFTVNALYYDVVGPREVITFSSGMDDLYQKVVRVIGDPYVRFEEDPVRMLRAMKLCGQYKFELGPKVEHAIAKLGNKIQLVSTSRLFEELLKIVQCKKTLAILEACRKYQFLKYFWPLLDECWDEAEGKLLYKLLSLRCQHVAKGDYSTSKALGMATVCLPFVMSGLNPKNISGFWKRSSETDALINKIIRVVFEQFNVPRMFTVRIREMVHLVPVLLGRPLSKRALDHTEYKYGRALVELLVEAYGWNKKLITDLPEAEEQPLCMRPKRNYSRSRKFSGSKKPEMSNKASIKESMNGG